MNPPNGSKINEFSNQLLNFVASPGPISAWDNQPPTFQQQTYTLVPSNIGPLLNQAILAQAALLNNHPFIPPHTIDVQPQQQRRWKKFRYRENKWQKNNIQRNFSQLDNQVIQNKGPDLRRKLNRRKSVSEFTPDVQNPGTISDNNIIQNNYRNEQNTKDDQCLDRSIKINVANLKTVTKTNADSDKWIFIVEKDIILENFNCLDDIVATDPDCHLVVPAHVLEELREHVCRSSDVRPRRTLRFLTQLIDNGKATSGPEISAAPARGSSYKTILTCVKLASQKNHVVVLIASQRDTLSYKPTSKNIHVFTMQDVKDILANKTVEIKNRAPSPTWAINIEVDNDLKAQNVANLSAIPVPGLFNHYSSQQSSNKQIKMISPPSATITAPPIDHPQKTNKTLSLQRTKVNVDSCTQPDEKITQKITELVSPDNHKINYQKLPQPEPRSPNVHAKTINKVHLKRQKITNLMQKSSQNSEQVVISPIKVNTSLPIPDKMLSNNHQVKCNTLHTGLTRNKEEINNDTYIGPKDTNNYNVVEKPMKKPFDISNSPKKTHSSPIKHNDNESMNRKSHDMDNSSGSSFSNISLDTVNVKKIISMKRLSNSAFPKTIDCTLEATLRSKTPSTSSRDKNYMNDESQNSNIQETLAIEETSNSAVISNSDSSHSERYNFKRQEARNVGKSRLRKVVLYTVAGQSMEEVLRLRSEEWVFRFVQIMEEVLRVKLQEKMDYEKGPAPRNLQDAAKCIIKKFDSHFNVVDAANQLSRLLYETSDKNGNIVNIEPSEYMELLSYGVYLVETFMDLNVDCKEADCRINKMNVPYKSYEVDKCSCLEVAAALDLLKKLLFDIQNSNADPFVDPTHPPVSPIDMDNTMDDFDQYDYGMKIQDHSSIEVPEIKDDKKQSEKTEIVQNDSQRFTYPNLRSVKRKLELQEENSPKAKVTGESTLPAKKTFDNNTKTRFFNHLQLSKKVTDTQTVKINPTPNENVPTASGKTSKSEFFNTDINKDLTKTSPIKVVSSNKADDTEIKQQHQEDQERLKCHFSKDDKLVKSPSKIVRQFVFNEELERKVKAKQGQKPEFTKITDNIPTENDKSKDKASIDKCYDYSNGTNEQNNENVSENKLLKKVEVENECKARFNCFVKGLTFKIGGVMTEVRTLCDSYVKQCMNKQSDISAQNQLLKVQAAYSLLLDIHKTLEIYKDNKGIDKNLLKLLDIENCDDYAPGENFCKQYRCIIATYAQHIGHVLKNVEAILNATQNRTQL